MSTYAARRTAADRLRELVGSWNPRAGVPAAVVYGTLLAVWLAGVVFTAAHHEFWRDEVRALTLTRTAGSPLELFRVIRDEGHPVLWYLLLYAGRAVADTPFVLPVLSIAVAFGAVALLLVRSPFPLWTKVLFLFGALPFYEYSVMARNYGISMLLLFVSAALYRRREEHPFALAVALALLANTNAHSVILALLLAGVWTWDAVAARGTASPRALGRSLYLPLLVVGIGVLVCAAVVYPKPETVVTDVRSLGAGDLARAVLSATLRPAWHFRHIVPYIPGPADQLLLHAAALGLLARVPLFLAALGATIGLGTFFQVVYVAGYRHEGLLLVFLLALYWIALDTWDRRAASRSRRVLFNAGLYLAMTTLLVKGVLEARHLVERDVRHELSASEAFGAFLASSGEYGEAVIVPEPSSQIESLPYYAGNPIYLPREERFGRVNSFTTRAKAHLSLGELLDAARGIREAGDRPVLVVLSHWELETDPSYRRRGSYGKSFTWTGDQLARLDSETELVAEFGNATGDERFRVYALK